MLFTIQIPNKDKQQEISNKARLEAVFFDDQCDYKTKDYTKQKTKSQSIREKNQIATNAHRQLGWGGAKRVKP